MKVEREGFASVDPGDFEHTVATQQPVIRQRQERFAGLADLPVDAELERLGHGSSIEPAPAASRRSASRSASVQKVEEPPGAGRDPAKGHFIAPIR